MRVVLAVEVKLRGRLQDETVGQQDVVVALQSHGALTAFTDECRRLGFEVVQRHALHAQRGPGLRGSGFEVLADAADHVPPWTDRMAPKRLDFSIFGLAVGAFAFGTQPKTIDVATDPAGQIPSQGAAVVGVLPFEFVGKEERVERGVMYGMTAMAAEDGSTVGVGQCRDGRTTFDRGSRLHLAFVHGLQLAMIH
ncbi:hypothetical protein D3C87_1485290 [compost metagenome]